MDPVTTTAYPARLDIDYPDRDLDRMSSFFRILFAIPIFIVLATIGGSTSFEFASDKGSQIAATGGTAIIGSTLLLILFRQKYPRWWFDFNLELTRFTTRIFSYVFLMNDAYPSTDEEQSVHLELDYPDAKEDLNRFLPLVKWLLAIPHFVVLIVLVIGALFAGIFAWFAILFTGRYPRGAFDYIEGVMRWGTRVEAYALLLITDRYPPFSLR